MEQFLNQLSVLNVTRGINNYDRFTWNFCLYAYMTSSLASWRQEYRRIYCKAKLKVWRGEKERKWVYEL